MTADRSRTPDTAAADHRWPLLRRPYGWCLVLAVVIGCHSDAFDQPRANSAGPIGSGNDVQLTINPEQDYWPAWTQDGKGILYEFVDAATPNHRCIGLLPAAGGARIWELCDNRAVRRDTSSNYGGFALDSTGRLLLTEGVSTSRGLLPQPISTLWLTDTAHPYVRTALATAPATIGGVQFTWFSQLQWTGPNTFVVLAGQFNTFTHCVFLIVTNMLARQCPSADTVWQVGPSAIASGTITGQGATLQLIAGTSGASEFSLANAGSTLVFAAGSRLYRVPATGGSPTPVTGVPAFGMQVAGVGCKGDSCLYALDSLAVSIDQPAAHFFFDTNVVPIGSMQLRKAAISGASDVLVAQGMAPVPYSSPAISPASGDVVVQVGGNWGRLQTYASYGSGQQILDARNGVLHLLKGIVP